MTPRPTRVQLSRQRCDSGRRAYAPHVPFPPRYYYGIHRDLDIFRISRPFPYEAGDATRRGKYRPPRLRA